MPGQIRYRISNIEAIQDGFLKLPDRIQRAILRRSVAASGRIIRKFVKQATPKSRVTGSRNLWLPATAKKRAEQRAVHGVKDPLADSLAMKPSSKWAGGAEAAKKGIIGTTVGHQKKIARHPHLVNSGHKLVFYGRKTNKFVEGTQYFNKAVRSAKGPAAKKMQDHVKARFEKEVEKHFKKLVKAVTNG